MLLLYNIWWKWLVFACWCSLTIVTRCVGLDCTMTKVTGSNTRDTVRFNAVLLFANQHLLYTRKMKTYFNRYNTHS